MKHKFAALLSLLLASVCWGQTPITGNNPILDSVTFPVFSVNVVPVPGATVAIVGAPGQATWYFWASANFQLGNVLSSLGSVSNAPNTLTSGNYVSIIPNAYPAGATTVDILATTGPNAPTGACNCAVATGLTSGGTNFQSNSLSSYTVSIWDPTAFELIVKNEVTGNGAVSLVLRNAKTGALICNLSIGCGSGTVSGSGTTNSIAKWTGSTALGNSGITDSGSLLATSETFQLIGANVFFEAFASPTTICPSAGTPPYAQASANCQGALGQINPAAGTTGVAAGSWGFVNPTNNLSSTPYLVGSLGSVVMAANGSPAQIAGVVGVTQTGGGTGTVALASGVYGLGGVGSVGSALQTATILEGVGGQTTVINAGQTNPLNAAFYAHSPILTGTATKNYGLYVDDQTLGGANNPEPHGIYVVGGGVQTKAVAFSTLKTCAAAYEGNMVAVTDSTTATWGATITGSSTNHVLAYCDGTNWTVAGK